MGNGVLGLLGATAMTVGLLLLAIKLLHKLDRRGVGHGRVPMQILQRLPLGAKQGVVVVRVGQRVLVLGTSDQGPSLLTELRREDRLAALADPNAGVPLAAARDPELKRLLSRLSLFGLMALTLAGTVKAQKPAAPKDSGRKVAISAPASVAPKQVTSAPGSGSIKVAAPDVPSVNVQIGQGNEQLKLSGSVGLVVFLGALTLLPAVVLLMTSFTRILVVLHFLRSAIGTQGSPPGQLLVAMAVLLTGVVMHPVLEEANQIAVQPYLNGHMSQADAYQQGLAPFRRFMLANVREKDLAAFTEMTGVAEAKTEDDIPTLTIISAFVTSELQTAFWMGFVIFLPFVVVDLIVATSLMSLGMFMVPPVMISLPFKLLLFVLADGWSLVGQNLVASFHR